MKYLFVFILSLLITIGIFNIDNKVWYFTYQLQNGDIVTTIDKYGAYCGLNLTDLSSGKKYQCQINYIELKRERK